MSALTPDPHVTATSHHRDVPAGDHVADVQLNPLADPGTTGGTEDRP